jgi:hypothetical protein
MHALGPGLRERQLAGFALEALLALEALQSAFALRTLRSERSDLAPLAREPDLAARSCRPGLPADAGGPRGTSSTRFAPFPGEAIAADHALLTLRALRTSCTSRPGRAALASGALRPFWPCLPALTDWPGLPAIARDAIRPALAGGTTLAGRPDFAGFTGWARWACRPDVAARTRRTRLADLASRTRRTRLATLADAARRADLSALAALAACALRAIGAGLAIGAIAHGRQARSDSRLQIAPQDHDLGAQLGDLGARMRFDQLDGALALPLLFGQNSSKRLAPRVN